jgi:hypothetical protein
MRSRRPPILIALLVASLASGGLAGSASAEQLVGLGPGNGLAKFDSEAPGNLTGSVPITGLQSGEQILGIDFRPANGQLYGLGSTNRLYTINPATGAATQVGSPGAFSLDGTSFGFDFNPVADRIRVVSNTGQNLRLNPNDGTLAGTDTPVAYATADANQGQPPSIVGSSYTNNFAQAPTTTLYGIDSNRDVLVIQNPPNGGTLNTVGPLGADVGDQVGSDVSPTGVPYLRASGAGSNDSTPTGTLLATLGAGRAPASKVRNGYTGPGTRVHSRYKRVAELPLIAGSLCRT